MYQFTSLDMLSNQCSSLSILRMLKGWWWRTTAQKLICFISTRCNYLSNDFYKNVAPLWSLLFHSGTLYNHFQKSWATDSLKKCFWKFSKGSLKSKDLRFYQRTKTLKGYIYNIQFIHSKNRMTEEQLKWANDNKYSGSKMYSNNLKITAQIKLFDKRRKLKKLLVIQFNEATFVF